MLVTISNGVNNWPIEMIISAATCDSKKSDNRHQVARRKQYYLHGDGMRRIFSSRMLHLSIISVLENVFAHRCSI